MRKLSLKRQKWTRMISSALSCFFYIFVYYLCTMIWIKRNKKHKNIERSQKRIKRGIMKDNKRNASLEYYGAERPKNQSFRKHSVLLSLISTCIHLWCVLKNLKEMSIVCEFKFQYNFLWFSLYNCKCIWYKYSNSHTVSRSKSY